jgi:hypothetical protein
LYVWFGPGIERAASAGEWYARKGRIAHCTLLLLYGY